MNKALRVLHVVVNMNRGGAETLIMNLYRNMDRNTIQFDFLTFKSGEFDAEIKQLGGIIHRIPYVTEVGHTHFKNKLEYFFKTHEPYLIVHSHLDKMSGLIMQAAKKAAIPIRIAHSHNTESEGTLLHKLYKTYAAKSLYSNVTHRFACSKAAAKWLFRRQSGDTRILKNGIELTSFTFHSKKQRDVRYAFDIRDTTTVFGHIGRFNEQKNHHHLIDIFTRIHAKIPDSMLVLVGDGLLKQSVEEKVIDLGLGESVLFLGVRKDIADLLQAFDIFLLPSLHEGLPVTLIEAQGADLPCMIADTITEEVDMGLGLIHRLPLYGVEEWIRMSAELVFSNRKRESRLDVLRKQGYDIKVTAQKLQTSYLAYRDSG